MKEFLAENWVVILGAVGTICTAIATSAKKKTPEERQAAKIAKAEKKAEKKFQAAKKATDKLIELKEGQK